MGRSRAAPRMSIFGEFQPVHKMYPRPESLSCERQDITERPNPIAQGGEARSACSDDERHDMNCSDAKVGNYNGVARANKERSGDIARQAPERRIGSTRYFAPQMLRKPAAANCIIRGSIAAMSVERHFPFDSRSIRSVSDRVRSRAPDKKWYAQ